MYCWIGILDVAEKISSRQDKMRRNVSKKFDYGSGFGKMEGFDTPIYIPIMCVWSSLIIIVLLFCLYALLYVKTIYGYGFLPAEKWDMVHMVFGAEMTIMSIFTNGRVVAYANNNRKVWKISIAEWTKKYFSVLIFFVPFFHLLCNYNPNM